MFARALFAVAFISAAFAAPLAARQGGSCFVVGNVALPKEVADSLANLGGVSCIGGTNLALGVPDVQSGSVKFSDIDFRDSDKSALGFALEKFAIPDDPRQANVALLQDQLNTYLAVEAGLRSVEGSKNLVGLIKEPKFFLQLQMARINQANGVAVGVAGTVEHQLGKVIKNAGRASAAEKAEAERIATLV